MSGHCAVLLTSTLFDHYGTPAMFYFLWIILGGLSGLKLVRYYIHTPLIPPRNVCEIAYQYKTPPLPIEGICEL
jgi:hypothetical protein